MTTPVIIISLIAVCLALSVGVLVFYKSQNKEEDNTNSSSETNASHPGPSEESLRDPVTKLYSRNHLLRRLDENMARCNRSHEALAVIVWDIDGFVNFNNTYGQKEGDRFLSRVSDIIKGCVRVYDEVFRSGPDEFCAILVPSDERLTRDVTSRVSQFVSKKLFEGDPGYATQKFSISAGFVSYPSENKVPESLLYAAEQELYKNRKEKIAK